MQRDPHRLHTHAHSREARSPSIWTPDRSIDGRALVRLTDDELRQLGLPSDAILTVDRRRRPNNGDLVWVELIRAGSIQRLIRRYALAGGWVTLTVADESSPAIMRRAGELLILGVVDVGRDAGSPAGPAAS